MSIKYRAIKDPHGDKYHIQQYKMNYKGDFTWMNVYTSGIQFKSIELAMVALEHLAASRGVYG